MKYFVLEAHDWDKAPADSRWWTARPALIVDLGSRYIVYPSYPEESRGEVRTKGDTFYKWILEGSLKEIPESQALAMLL